MRWRIRLRAAAFVCGALGLAPSPLPHPAEPTLQAVWGVTPEGAPTEEWLKLLRRRLDEGPYRQAADLNKPATAAETRWAELIRSRVPVWETRREEMASLYRPAPPPAKVRIVMGNRGADDAFTHDAVTIGFDLSALQNVYGDADREENLDRIDRLFRHEFTHLMQKAWLVDHPYAAATPLQAALLDIWLEGVGNLQSLSARWRTSEGVDPPPARDARARLEPRLVARLAALACASPGQGELLMTGLSRGPFDQKWGALTMALWLESEGARDAGAVRRYIEAGPEGFWELAGRQLPPPLRAALEEARAAASLCPGP